MVGGVGVGWRRWCWLAALVGGVGPQHWFAALALVCSVGSNYFFVADILATYYRYTNIDFWSVQAYIPDLAPIFQLYNANATGYVFTPRAPSAVIREVVWIYKKKNSFFFGFYWFFFVDL